MVNAQALICFGGAPDETRTALLSEPEETVTD